MKLRNKLLYAFIAMALVLALGVLLLLSYGFKQGVSTFLLEEDEHQLSLLRPHLAQYYEQHQSWLEFEDSFTWNQWIINIAAGTPNFSKDRQSARVPAPPNFPPQKKDSGKEKQPSHLKPFFLLDKNKKIIVGEQRKNSMVHAIHETNMQSKPIVGYVGLPPPPARMDHLWDSPLASKQLSLLILFSLGTLVVASMIAIPLSRKMTQRILKLHNHVTTLTQGQYLNQINPEGKDEISELAQNLNTLANTLHQADEQRKQMTMDVSHELRTPVATLQANIEAMQDEVLPLNQESLQQLHDQVRRLSNLINDLYQMSLVDANALQYYKTECDLEHVIESVASDFKPLFIRQNIDFTYDRKLTAAAMLWADAERLKQLFTNIFENSRRYTNSPGTVHLILSEDQDNFVIQIEDSAPGVPTEALERLTERLFRVDASRNRNSGGAGLGLNLVSAIVKAHNGSLKFNASHLGGLCVTITFPKLRQDI